MEFSALNGRLGLNVAPWVNGLSRATAATKNFVSGTVSSMGQAVSAGQGAVGQAAAAQAKVTQSFAASIAQMRGGLSALFAHARSGAQATTAALAVMSSVGVATGGVLIKLASNAEEAASKFQVTFKSGAASAASALEKFSAEAGRSQFKLKGMAADIGALIAPLGLGDRKVGEMSVALTKLAVDLSSFHNVSEEDALGALRSALSGETEPMKRFGVVLNDVALKAEAIRLGLDTSGATLSASVKAQAAYSLIMKRTADAQGDAIRTGGGFANQIRRLKDAIYDTATIGGNVLLPVATEVVRVFNDMMKPVQDNAWALSRWGDANRDLLATKTGEYLASLIGGARDLFTALGNVKEMVSAQVVPAFRAVREQWRGGLSVVKEYWSALPAWAKDLVSVVGAATGLGTVLSGLGGALPIIGPLFSILGGMVNPLGLLVNLFGALSPLVTVLGAAFSPLGVTVAALVTGFVGIADAVGKYNELFGTGTTAVEQLRAVWDALVEAFERVAEVWGPKLSQLFEALWPQIERIQVKVGELASRILDGLVAAFGAAAGASDSTLGAAFDAFVAGPAAAMFNVIEAIIDLLNGEFSGATAIIKEAMAGLVSVGVMFAETAVKFGEYLGIEEEYRAGAKKDLEYLRRLEADLSRDALKARREANAGQSEKSKEIEAAKKAAQDRRAAGGVAAPSSVGSRETATSDSGAFDYTVSEKDPTKPVVVQGVAGGVASGAPSVAGPAGSTAAASASQPGGQAAAIAAAKAQTAAMGLGPGPAETAATRDQGTGLAIDESLQSAGAGALAGLSVTSKAGTNRRINELLQGGGPADTRKDVVGKANALGATKLETQELLASHSELMKSIDAIRGLSGQAKLDAIKNAQEQWVEYEKLYGNIAKEAKATNEAVTNSDDEAATKREAIIERERKARERLNESRKPKRDSESETDASGGSANGGKGAKGGGSGGGGLGGSMNAIGQMGASISGAINSALGGVGQGMAAFTEAVQRESDPVKRIELEIAALNGQLSQARNNARIIGSASAIGAAKEIEAQIASLRKQQERIRARRKAVLTEMVTQQGTASAGPTPISIGGSSSFFGNPVSPTMFESAVPSLGAASVASGFRNDAASVGGDGGRVVENGLTINLQVNGAVNPRELLEMVDSAAKEAGFDRTGRSVLRSKA